MAQVRRRRVPLTCAPPAAQRRRRVQHSKSDSDLNVKSIRPSCRALWHVWFLYSGPAYAVSAAVASHHQVPSRQRCGSKGEAMIQPRSRGAMQTHITSVTPLLTPSITFNPPPAHLPVRAHVTCVHNRPQHRVQRLPPAADGGGAQEGPSGRQECTPLLLRRNPCIAHACMH